MDSQTASPMVEILKKSSNTQNQNFFNKYIMDTGHQSEWFKPWTKSKREIGTGYWLGLKRELNS